MQESGPDSLVPSAAAAPGPAGPAGPLALPAVLARLLAREHLSRAEARAAMAHMVEGDWTPEQCAAFLVALSAKGETPQELAGMAEVMRARAQSVDLSALDPVDTCGTGGDGAGSFNISTAAALVAAGAGVRVAKHGNRAVSSRAGSADVLEALGVPIEPEPARAASMLERAGFVFLFAPRHHPAMRRLAPLRRALGIRTAMNALGPLCSPARVRRQLVGVYSAPLVERMAGALLELGIEAALVVHGEDGLDEISLGAPSLVASVRAGRVHIEQWDPEVYGLRSAPREALRGGDAQHNARLLEAVLQGRERGPRREVVVLNAAAVILLADRADEIREAMAQARAAIDSGAAWGVVETLRQLG
ncbi:MAG: anthranilate phosphoribosyltransferase [Planctomycetota bacterium]|nr:MAG: anthranilate phosphoribosyltransferase [Planctomycetota bacterium]